MEISIFGMKFRVEILILIVVLYFILWGHVLCSCSRVNLMEALGNMYNSKTNRAILNWEVLKNPTPRIGMKEVPAMATCIFHNLERLNYNILKELKKGKA